MWPGAGYFVGCCYCFVVFVVVAVVFVIIGTGVCYFFDV